MAATARNQLLARCVDHLQRTGFGDLSLREIAAGVGTSHRMLLYHFGSREGLLAAAVEYLEAQQRAVLADLAAEGDDLETACRRFWLRISDPDLAPAERLFFEVYASALHRRPWTESFRRTVIAAWDEPLTALFRRHGFGETQARHRARLALAAARGLLLDLLLTDDRAAVDAAGEWLVAALAAAPDA